MQTAISAHGLQNNADEGPLLTPQNVITEDDFIDFLHNTFPLFTNDDISRVLLYYPSTNASVDMGTPEFATSGNSVATALNESIFGTGQQQRADVRNTPFLKTPATDQVASLGGTTQKY